ncbi:MAG: heme exporter protein CcmD [Betaproteobacteria bacterium]|nr:heme exporter protein CcmD [Betaproteobacteria bacterium]
MQWNSVGEFFAMGGYALYVWGSFGACAILLIAEPFLAKRRLKQIRQSLIRERLADELESQQRTQ